jgi:hypothetical protein
MAWYRRKANAGNLFSLEALHMMLHLVKLISNLHFLNFPIMRSVKVSAITTSLVNVGLLSCDAIQSITQVPFQRNMASIFKAATHMASQPQRPISTLSLP